MERVNKSVHRPVTPSEAGLPYVPLQVTEVPSSRTADGSLAVCQEYNAPTVNEMDTEQRVSVIYHNILRHPRLGLPPVGPLQRLCIVLLLEG